MLQFQFSVKLLVFNLEVFPRYDTKHNKKFLSVLNLRHFKIASGIGWEVTSAVGAGRFLSFGWRERLSTSSRKFSQLGCSWTEEYCPSVIPQAHAFIWRDVYLDAFPILSRCSLRSTITWLKDSVRFFGVAVWCLVWVAESGLGTLVLAWLVGDSSSSPSSSSFAASSENEHGSVWLSSSHTDIFLYNFILILLHFSLF